MSLQWSLLALEGQGIETVHSAMNSEQSSPLSAQIADCTLSEPHPYRRRGVALVVVFIVSAATVAASQLTKSAQTGLHAPFFIMYMHIAMMAICWPVAKALGKGLRVTASLGDVGFFLPIWVASNYCFVAALSRAPAGLVQTLFGTAPAIVAVMSRVVLLEPFTTLRIVAVIFAFLGTAGVGSGEWSTDPTKHSNSVLLGGAFAFAAVLAAASYKVAFKSRLGEPPISIVLGFVGTLGLVAAIFGLPIVVTLCMLGAEDCWWDGSVHINWKLVFASAAVDVIYNTSIACGLAIASPIFVALGVVAGIPANLVIDALVNDEVPGLVESVGAIFIATSFAILALGPMQGDRKSVV